MDAAQHSQAADAKGHRRHQAAMQDDLDPLDLARHPRVMDDDLEACRKAGVDLVFAPPAQEMYPEGADTCVEVTALAAPLCGGSRPGHFRGVTTVGVSQCF